MAKPNGNNLWDDPNYVLGTIEPLASNFDLGSSQRPFRNLYLSGSAIIPTETLANNTFLLSENAAGSGTVNLIKANASDNIVLGTTVLPAADSAQDFGSPSASWRFGYFNQLTLTTATSQIIPGATSLSFKNNGNSATNLSITDAGLVSVVRGNLAVTTGEVVLGATASKIVPGATSLSLRNHADAADNFIILDAGSATLAGTLTITAGDAVLTNGNVLINTAGKGLQVKSGANAKAGTVTANGASSVTVSTTAITANSTVIFGLKTVGGTILGAPYMFTVTPGTSFTVRAGASDTSVYNWVIVDLI